MRNRMDWMEISLLFKISMDLLTLIDGGHTFQHRLPLQWNLHPSLRDGSHRCLVVRSRSVCPHVRERTQLLHRGELQV